jgi:hypothetical protein
MADYYLNSDYYGCDTIARRGCCDSGPSVQGIQYRVITDLDSEPVSVDFFKQWARIDFNTDDELIESILKSARQYLEQWSQLSFGEKTIRFTAIKVPNNWQLMFGPYAADALLSGDILITGGPNVSHDLVTEWTELPEAIKIAICKRAAGDYCIRENYVITDKGAIQTPEVLYDEAQKLLQPYMNISWP